jgi:hypothetical protein
VNATGVYVTGVTAATGFPAVSAFQPAFGGLLDAFVAKLAENQPPRLLRRSSPAFRDLAAERKLVPVAIHGVTDPDGDSVTLAVTSIRQDEPLSKRGSPDAAGVGTATLQVRADRLGGGDGRASLNPFLSFCSAPTL